MNKFIRIMFLLGGMAALPLWGQLVFEQEQIEYQAGLMDDKTEASFKFTNTGDSEITIKSVRSSCGCTVPKLAKKTYGPGESGEIKAVFTYGARVGQQVKRITVELEDPGSRAYALTLVTDIPEWLVIEPRILRWGIGGPDEPRTFRVKLADPDKISLEDHLPEPKSFSLDREQVEPGVYLFTVTPKSTTDRVTEFIQLSASAQLEDQSKSRKFGVHCLIR